tara:strand:- start:2430 stop:3305 length:876 start_codon:yes stop_codon:yes gene_type:complete
MPELPEVEVVRQSLNKKIIQKKVKKVIIRNRNLRFKIPLNFENFLQKKKIIKVNRFSKYLIFTLSNKSFILLHLGMSGTVHLIDRNKKSYNTSTVTNTSFYSRPTLPKKHNHIEIIFENIKVVYNDPRRFGFIQILKDISSLKRRFANFGPEPFQLEFNSKYILSFFKKKNKCVKNFLLDQNFVSGIGNIYASEILFLSKINPGKEANLLNIEDCKRITLNSRKVLMDAIKKGGSSIKDFKNVSGKKGGFQKNFKVYERQGLKCKRKNCSGTIQKKTITNRSTFFCNTCQN